MNKSVSQYLSEIGRRGGLSKSARKTKASRENGKKGGRKTGPFGGESISEGVKK